MAISRLSQHTAKYMDDTLKLVSRGYHEIVDVDSGANKWFVEAYDCESIAGFAEAGGKALKWAGKATGDHFGGALLEMVGEALMDSAASLRDGAELVEEKIVIDSVEAYQKYLEKEAHNRRRLLAASERGFDPWIKELIRQGKMIPVKN